MTAPPANGPALREGAKYASPFTQLIALGWYDGPTHGLVQANNCSWKFDMVDEIHNPDGLDCRIFALAPLPTAAWDELTTAEGGYLTAKGPVSVPRWQFSSDADRQSANRVIDVLLSQKGPVEWVVAAEDLLQEIVGAKPVTPLEWNAVRDWAAFLFQETPS